MKKTALLCALLLAGCGPETPGPAFPIELYVAAGLKDDIQAFQFSLVTRGTSLECLTVQKSCIKDQVPPERFVKFKNAQGRDVETISFDLSTLMSGSPNTQDVSLTGLPIGKDYALVVEAVSTDATPRLAGSSCNYIQTLNAGMNPAVAVRIEVLNPRVACDPRH